MLEAPDDQADQAPGTAVSRGQRAAGRGAAAVYPAGRRDDRGAAGIPAATSPVRPAPVGPASPGFSAAAGRVPYASVPPPGPFPPDARPSPSFTPRPPDDEERPGTGARHSRHGGRPRPTFTPREGYIPPADRARPAPAPTAFLPPVPAGYPQPSFQPFDYPEAPPRFVPACRPGGPAGRPGLPDQDPAAGQPARPPRPGRSSGSAPTPGRTWPGRARRWPWARWPPGLPGSCARSCCCTRWATSPPPTPTTQPTRCPTPCTT